MVHSQSLPEIPAAPLMLCVGLLENYLTSFLLVFSYILEGCPVLGIVTVEPYFLHLIMAVFTVYHGISNALEIIVYPSPE